MNRKTLSTSVAAALLLTACNPKTQEAPPPETQPQPTEEPTKVETPVAKTGDTAPAAPMDERARMFIAQMDARPPDQRVPNWDEIKAMMMRQPPRVGAEAPDFTLKKQDGSGSIQLSQFKGSRPVVLIFGSWT